MNSAAANLQQHKFRVESDSLGEVNVPTSKRLCCINHGLEGPLDRGGMMSHVQAPPFSC
jgi:hypothetical protein